MTITTAPTSPNFTLAGLDLYTRGSIDLTAPRVAVVGARAATPYGEQVAADLAASLTARGVVVVTGGAYGIDVAATRAALAEGGTPLVLLAAGTDCLYPAGNAKVLTAVAERGMLASEHGPGVTPTRTRFLERNAALARLATHGVIVVEAAARSGALVTARAALDLGRKVYAVPGPVTSLLSEGTHALIREGVAELLTDAADVEGI